MSKLKIHLLLPFKKHDKIVTKKVSCQGVVVRTESQPQKDYFYTAIYFNDIKKNDMKCISDYINATMARPLALK